MQEENKNGSFSFINEKRKEKPVNKKKLLLHTGYVVGLAVIFGLVASFVFAFFQPKFAEMLYPEQEPVYTIPKDSEELFEDTETTETAENMETESTESPENAEGQKPPLDGTAPEGQNPTDGITQEGQNLPVDGVTPEGENQEPRELEIADFQHLQNKMYAIGREANKFVVTVTGVKSDTDWFNNPYESKGQSSGIIIANNGQELLILTERKAISDAQHIYVTFINEVSLEASMKKYDGNTGITVLSIPIENVDEETLGAISVATLGNSLGTIQGTLVIAVGSPLGTNYSILTGNVTSTTNTISTMDNNYTVFTTDIVGSSNGSGALINVKGEVMGLVMQDYSSKGDRNTLTALSISELKAMIEKLSNGQDIPYIGLELTTVTNDIAKEYDIPKGAYIKEVKVDSPAMAAGLQSGDVITMMDGETIMTVDHYESKLLSLEPGKQVKISVQRQGAEGYTEITCTAKVSVLR
ncbi:MAG: serine protease [Roseburia sp.]|nr:serine protease [Roseburia sp.]